MWWFDFCHPLSLQSRKNSFMFLWCTNAGQCSVPLVVSPACTGYIHNTTVYNFTGTCSGNNFFRVKKWGQRFFALCSKHQFTLCNGIPNAAARFKVWQNNKSRRLFCCIYQIISAPYSFHLALEAESEIQEIGLLPRMIWISFMTTWYKQQLLVMPAGDQISCTVCFGGKTTAFLSVSNAMN